MIRKALYLVLALSFSLAACMGSKKVTPEQVMDAVVVAMCKKMVTCQPNAMPTEDFCKDAMKKALANNQNIPKVNATQKQLDACTGSIGKSDCETLLGSKPPEGCEFLQ